MAGSAALGVAAACVALLYGMTREVATIEWRPLRREFGAIVDSADLATMSRVELEVVHAVLVERGLVILRRQFSSLNATESLHRLYEAAAAADDARPDAMASFAVADPSCAPGLPGCVRALGNVADPLGAIPELNRIGLEWHTDGQGITALYAAKIDGPRTTLFASGREAHDALSPAQQRLAASLEGRFGPGRIAEESVAECHRLGARLDDEGLGLASGVDDDALDAAQLERKKADANRRRWAHYDGSPVRRHPKTLETVLFATPIGLERYAGYDGPASSRLLADLLRPGTRPHRVYEHLWQPGDVVFFDNRKMLHATTPCSPDPHLLYQIFMRTADPMLRATALPP